MDMRAQNARVTVTVNLDDGGTYTCVLTDAVVEFGFTSEPIEGPPGGGGLYRTWIPGLTTTLSLRATGRG